MSNNKLEIVYLPIDSLKPYEKNARKHQKADIEVIKNSIEQFDMCDPIGIWGDKNIIVEGHGRWMALKELNYKEVPCIRLDHLTDEQRKAYALTHNRSAELSSWDFDTLDEELAALKDEFDMVDLGFEDLLEEEPELEPKDDEFDPDEFQSQEDISKLGDVYKLGRHTLMCGDSRKEEDIDKLIGDQKIAAVFTDPPWNVDYGGTSHPSWRKRTILNDKMSPQDFNYFLTDAFVSIKNHLTPGCMVYCVMSAQEWGNIMDVMSAQDYHWSSTIIWAKDSLVLSRKDYHTQYEPIWYGWFAGKDNAPRLCPLEDRTQSDLWEIPRPKVSELHPTMKPVELVARSFQNSSKEGDNVLDIFGGSGTSIIAAEQTKRNCYMMELDPHYVDVIVKRYIRYVGSAKDCTLNGGPLPESMLEGVLDSDIE